MATCKHGETEPHGEIGKDFCAGPPRSWMFEAFRPQLEEQMNLDTDMFTRFAEAQEIDASQVPDDINEPFVIRGDQTARMSSYAIPTTTDVDEAMRHGVGLWQIHSPTTAELVREYERSGTERVKAAYERYAPAWSTVLRIGADLGDGVEVLAPMTLDHIENFIPMGWTASWGEHWYADPRAPLYVRDWGAEVSFDGEHWTSTMTVGTPLYDTLVAERGDPREN